MKASVRRRLELANATLDHMDGGLIDDCAVKLEDCEDLDAGIIAVHKIVASLQLDGLRVEDLP